MMKINSLMAVGFAMAIVLLCSSPWPAHGRLLRSATDNSTTLSAADQDLVTQMQRDFEADSAKCSSTNSKTATFADVINLVPSSLAGANDPLGLVAKVQSLAAQWAALDKNPLLWAALVAEMSLILQNKAPSMVIKTLYAMQQNAKAMQNQVKNVNMLVSKISDLTGTVNSDGLITSLANQVNMGLQQLMASIQFQISNIFQFIQGAISSTIKGVLQLLLETVWFVLAAGIMAFGMPFLLGTALIKGLQRVTGVNLFPILEKITFVLGFLSEMIGGMIMSCLFLFGRSPGQCVMGLVRRLTRATSCTMLDLAQTSVSTMGKAVEVLVFASNSTTAAP